VKKLAIVGASGHGKVVAELAELLGYKVIFFDDSYPEQQQIEHWPVVGVFEDLLCNQKQYPEAIVAIGHNGIRSQMSEQLEQKNFTLPTLVHPTAYVSKHTIISKGTVVLAKAVVNAFSQIGRNCIINTGVIVEHDCKLGDSVHLSPSVSLAGGTKVGDASWLGISSVTKQLIDIGAHTIIGANSTVLQNMPSNVTAFGSPAVIKKYH